MPGPTQVSMLPLLSTSTPFSRAPDEGHVVDDGLDQAVAQADDRLRRGLVGHQRRAVTTEAEGRPDALVGVDEVVPVEVLAAAEARAGHRDGGRTRAHADAHLRAGAVAVAQRVGGEHRRAPRSQCVTGQEEVVLAAGEARSEDDRLQAGCRVGRAGHHGDADPRPRRGDQRQPGRRRGDHALTVHVLRAQQRPEPDLRGGRGVQHGGRAQRGGRGRRHLVQPRDGGGLRGGEAAVAAGEGRAEVDALARGDAAGGIGGAVLQRLPGPLQGVAAGHGRERRPALAAAADRDRLSAGVQQAGGHDQREGAGRGEEGVERARHDVGRRVQHQLRQPGSGHAGPGHVHGGGRDAEQVDGSVERQRHPRLQVEAVERVQERQVVAERAAPSVAAGRGQVHPQPGPLVGVRDGEQVVREGPRLGGRPREQAHPCRSRGRGQPDENPPGERSGQDDDPETAHAGLQGEVSRPAGAGAR